MKDYNFGNYLYELRKKSNFSQAELACLLGVTNKAVSKWETGNSKPGIDTIKKLASIFNVTIDSLLSNENDNKKITKIVITGGPCAGKSTALSKIQKKRGRIL